MVLTVPLNTYNALLDAPARGIVPRYFAWIKALNTQTDEIEEIGLWNGPVPVSVAVIQPGDGATVTRPYQGVAGLMQAPSIPMTMKLEVRTVKLVFSNLTPEIINVVKVYKAKNHPIEIHRGLLDPSTMNLVDPALCIFDGATNRAPIKRGKPDNPGSVTIECQSHARTLAMGSSEKFSAEFLKRRGADYPWIDAPASVTWGQEDFVKEARRPKKSKWID